MDEQESIEKYLSGRLTEQELSAFKRKLATDHELAQSLAEQRLGQLAAKTMVRQELRQRVQEQLLTAPTKKNLWPRRLRLLSVAAAFLLLVSLAWWRFGPTSAPEANDYLASYFEAPAPLAARFSPNTETNYQRAIDYYSNSDYQNAIPLLQTVAADIGNPETQSARLLLGGAYLALGQPAQAVAPLQSISDESVFVQEKSWYLALAHLAVGAPEAAGDVLQAIAANDQHYKQQEAIAILEGLGND